MRDYLLSLWFKCVANNMSTMPPGNRRHAAPAYPAKIVIEIGFEIEFQTYGFVFIAQDLLLLCLWFPEVPSVRRVSFTGC